MGFISILFVSLVYLCLTGAFLTYLIRKTFFTNFNELILYALAPLFTIGLALTHLKMFTLFWPSFIFFTALVFVSFLFKFIFYFKSHRQNITFKNIFSKENLPYFALFLLSLLSLYGKTPLSNVIFFIGDAGHYINSANHMAQTGEAIGGFFPLQHTLLAIYSLLFGASNTPVAVLLISMLIPFSFYQLLETFFENKKVSFLGTVLIMFNILFMWFGRLQYSEILMAYLNINFLNYYIQFKKTDKSSDALFAIIMCFLISSTRITGLVLMIILSVDFIFNLLYFKNNSIKNLYFILGSYVSYFIAVFLEMSFGYHYYVNLQLNAYFPLIKDYRNWLIFHAIWPIMLIACFFILKNKESLFKKTIFFLKKHHVPLSILLFLILLPLSIRIMNRYSSWNKIIYINYYTLKSYFSALYPLAIIPGLYLLFKKNNFLNDRSKTIFWLFSGAFIVLYHARIKHFSVHDVYLYWDRYYLSELSIVMAIIICSFFRFIDNRKLKYLVIVYFSFNLFQSYRWMRDNRDMEYLQNGFALLDNIYRTIDQKEAPVFMDSTLYKKRWVYSNFRQSISSPLKNSFQLKVIGNGPYETPVQKDNPINESVFQEEIKKKKMAYVLQISEEMDENKKWPLSQRDLFDIKKIGHFSTTIFTKSHAYRKIFHQKRKSFPVTVQIFEVKEKNI